MKPFFYLGLIALIPIVGCGDGNQASSVVSTAMPEVNEENCQPEKVKALSEDIRKKFGSQCWRRTNFKRSDDIAWTIDGPVKAPKK